MTAINETFKLLPPEAKQEVAKEILRFSGSWKDMDESDFESLICDIFERREKSFIRRRNL